MRKERPVSRGLPSDGGSKNRLVDRDQNEPISTGEMPGGGFSELICGGEMDVAIAMVEVSTRKRTLAQGRTPDRQRTYLVDHRLL